MSIYLHIYAYQFVYISIWFQSWSSGTWAVSSGRSGVGTFHFMGVADHWSGPRMSMRLCGICYSKSRIEACFHWHFSRAARRTQALIRLALAVRLVGRMHLYTSIRMHICTPAHGWTNVLVYASLWDKVASLSLAIWDLFVFPRVGTATSLALACPRPINSEHSVIRRAF